jgi:hypothetical protein
VDDETDFTPWTEEGRERLRAAATRLAQAVLDHAEAVAAVTGATTEPVFDAGDPLVEAAMQYVDAQFEYTGIAYPLGVLGQLIDADDDEAADGDEYERPTTGVTVLRRADFAVLDEDAVIEAGRAAYLEVWPEDSAEAAAADVSYLGRALYQIGHARGWDALPETAGLRPLGGLVRIQLQDEALGNEPDEWPEDVFVVDGETIYELSEVYP